MVKALAIQPILSALCRWSEIPRHFRLAARSLRFHGRLECPPHGRSRVLSDPITDGLDMSTDAEQQLIEHMVRLVRRAALCDYVEMFVGDDVVSMTASDGTSPTGTSLIAPRHLDSPPHVGSAVDLVDAIVGDGSIAVYPITGPSAESGTLLVYWRELPVDDGEALTVLGSAVALIEGHLDQVVERLRLDQLSDVLRRKQDELRAAQAQLQLSNNELEQFAYIAAHELLAPLRSVAVYAEVLRMNPGDLEEQQLQLCANEIRSGVASMDRQIRQLLELSSTQSQASDPEPVDLNDAVKNATDSLSDEIEKADASLVVGQLPTVGGSPVLLQSVFVNLISNAVKFRSASRPLTVEIRAEQAEGESRIMVIDNGQGVDSADQARIFGLFERASTSTSGSGIGLGLSRRILEAFGGTLTYSRREEGGSCFTLTFPPMS